MGNSEAAKFSWKTLLILAGSYVSFGIGVRILPQV